MPKTAELVAADLRRRIVRGDLAEGRAHASFITGQTPVRQRWPHHFLRSGGSLITAVMLDTFSVSATGDRLAAALAGRYGGQVDRVAPYGTDLQSAETRQRWRQATADLRNQP